jgi:hypothetical protein
MIGYLAVESMRVGAYMSPWMSVVPSRAFMVIGVGGRQPAATRRETSARSSSISTRPFPSRSTLTGGVAGVEYVSMNDRPSGAIEIA